MHVLCRPPSAATDFPEFVATQPLSSVRLSQAERTERSDRRMIEAAICLLVKNGSEKTTLKAIGEAAGYSRGLATYRFGSKAALLRAVVDYVSRRWVRHLKVAVDGLTGIEAMRAAVDLQRRLAEESPDEIRTMFNLWYESVRPRSGFRADVARIHQRQRADVARWIREGVEAGALRNDLQPEREAAQFLAGMFGLIYQWLVEPEAVDLDAAHKDFKQTLTLRLTKEPKS